MLKQGKFPGAWFPGANFHTIVYRQEKESSLKRLDLSAQWSFRPGGLSSDSFVLKDFGWITTASYDLNNIISCNILYTWIFKFPNIWDLCSAPVFGDVFPQNDRKLGVLPNVSDSFWDNSTPHSNTPQVCLMDEGRNLLWQLHISLNLNWKTSWDCLMTATFKNQNRHYLGPFDGFEWEAGETDKTILGFQRSRHIQKQLLNIIHVQYRYL